MQLVPAICPRCGGKLQTNPLQDTAICPYCETSYIVDQAIDKYKVSVKDSTVFINNAVIRNGEDPDNLAARGDEFRKAGNIAKAVSYYNKALDVDVNCIAARNGMRAIDLLDIDEFVKNGKDLDNPEYYDETVQLYKKIISRDPANTYVIGKLEEIRKYFAATPFFSDKAHTHTESGTLTILRTRIEFTGEKTGSHTFLFKDMTKFKADEDLKFAGETFGRLKPNCLTFSVEGNSYTFRIHKASEIEKTVIKWSRYGFDI